MKFLKEFNNRISSARDGSVGKMIDAIGEGIAFNFFVDREGAFLIIVVKSHAGGIEACFALDVITKFRVFDNHFGPERISGETEEEAALVGCDFEDDVGPAGDDLFDVSDFMVR